jgi:YidC/Oxa1 family membrane protein insertase
VVKKSFAFDHSYVVHVETSVTRNGQAVQAYPAWPAGIGDQSGPTAFVSAQSVYLDGQEVVRQTAHEKRFLRSDRWVVGGGTINGPLRWAGIADQYFAAIFLPDQPQDAAMVTLNHPFDIPKDREKPNPNETVSVPVIGAAVGNVNGATSARLFVGPKNKEVLETVRAMENGKPTGESLESTRDLGTFGFIAKPMFVWLQWTQDHLTKNWGWAIVVLTLIINFALTPLRIMAMKQSLKMQRIQPQREAIQKKYEKYDFRDPRRAQMNQEIMDLHKREGVKMTGGCLPLLPQLPILYAFYAMLANAIELRHAHWAWIHDLSAPDPWHLLPILTIATMLLMQKMMPQIGMDPTQRMMMNVMSPLMFGMFTWAAASGLALYWTVGSVIGLGQQWIINQTKLGRELREMQLKRAKKK